MNCESQTAKLPAANSSPIHLKTPTYHSSKISKTDTKWFTTGKAKLIV